MVLKTVCIAAICALALPAGAQGTLYSLTTSDYLQSFDYPNFARVGIGALMAAGWTFSETLPGADGRYSTSRGDDVFGDTYSYGPQGQDHNDRALGTLRSSTVASQFGVQFVNQLGYTITSLTISYTGEQWRLGNRTGGAADRLDFAYMIGDGSLTSGTWVDVNNLDFLSPVTSGRAGALNGNDPANQTFLTFEITGLSITNGQSFWFRWSDYANPDGNDGLAIDNFSLQAIPEPPLWAVALLLAMGWWIVHPRRDSPVSG